MCRRLVARNKENAGIYYDELQGVPGLTLPERREGFDSSYWLFTIRVADRPAFVRSMDAAGIQVNQVHTRNDKYSALGEFQAELPQMDRIADDMICIPVGWWIGETERRRIINTIKRGW